ncbi:MAG: hypothetical protein HY820_12815 [Acidobacteria bacterium]|nr:hypothetical protein [Acidobacteriota bacterium]
MKPTEQNRKAMQARWNIAQANKRSVAHTASHYLLPADSQDEFNNHLAAFLETFDPRGHVEQLLVHQMATLQWQILRAGAMQEALLGLEADNCAKNITSTYKSLDRPAVWAIAYRSLEDNTPAHHRLDLHINRLNRQYTRTYSNFTDMRARRFEDNCSETPTPGVSPVIPITSKPESEIDNAASRTKEHR